MEVCYCDFTTVSIVITMSGLTYLFLMAIIWKLLCKSKDEKPVKETAPAYSRTAYHGNGGFWRGYHRNLGFSFSGWQPSPYFRVCKPSPPSQPWAQRRLAPYFRQATVALHPAHPHNLGLPMGLSECRLVFCTMALNPAHPGNLGSLGAPFLQLHVARLCPLEPTLATLPPTTPATFFSSTWDSEPLATFRRYLLDPVRLYLILLV